MCIVLGRGHCVVITKKNAIHTEICGDVFIFLRLMYFPLLKSVPPLSPPFTLFREFAMYVDVEMDHPVPIHPIQRY
jgi:hypothetical protein